MEKLHYKNQVMALHHVTDKKDCRRGTSEEEASTIEE